jgi:hypothetical protein
MLTAALEGRIVLIELRCGIGYVLHMRCVRVERSMEGGVPGVPSPSFRLLGALLGA